jgi:hypothetical protein
LWSGNKKISPFLELKKEVVQEVGPPAYVRFHTLVSPVPVWRRNRRRDSAIRPMTGARHLTSRTIVILI